MRNLTESEYVEAMSAFEGLQIKPTYLPIDIRLSVNDVTNMLKEKRPQHVLLPHKIYSRREYCQEEFIKIVDFFI